MRKDFIIDPKKSRFESYESIVDKLTDVFFITIIFWTSIFLLASVAFVIDNYK